MCATFELQNLSKTDSRGDQKPSRGLLMGRKDIIQRLISSGKFNSDSIPRRLALSRRNEVREDPSRFCSLGYVVTFHISRLVIADFHEGEQNIRVSARISVA